MCQSIHRYALLCFFCLFSGLLLTAQGQVLSRRISLNKAGATRSVGTGLPTLTLPDVDVIALLAEDERERKLGLPFRFGVKQTVDMSLLRDGIRLPGVGHSIIRCRIQATGAFSVNLLFDQFRLAEGAELTLYNADSTFIVGPIVSDQNPPNNQCWLDLLPGSEVILELREPANAPQPSVVHLHGVVHGYKNTFPTANKAFGGAAPCERNVACYPTYQTEADGVAMILLADGTRWCTGSLINTVNQQFRSFLLTAFHCLDTNDNGLIDPTEGASVQNWLFRFGYQSPGCSPSAEDVNFITMNGADLRASRRESDFVLLELRQQIASAINPTYIGWDRSTTLPSSMAAIHHPAGDVKKISFATGTATLTDYVNPAGTTHFQVQWGELGVTEPGSSGSPLFDGNRRIVGQLHGGPSYCGAPMAMRYDLYGRLSLSWNGGTSPATRLRDWLDPSNLFTTAPSGKPTLTGPATLTGTGTYQLNVNHTNSVTWRVTGPPGVVLSRVVSVTSGTGPIASLSVLASASNLSITFGVSAGQSYPIQFTRPFETASARATEPLPLLTEQPLYNCTTHQLTLRASGGATIGGATNGGATNGIEFMVVGVRRWETNPVVILPDALLADPETNNVTIFTRQLNGKKPPTLSSRVFDFRAGCPR